MSSLPDPTEAASPEQSLPAPPRGPDSPTSGADLNELLSEGARVAFRGSIYVDGQHYPHGQKLAGLCEDLDLEYKQAVTKSRCDLLVTDDLEAQDNKAELASRYDKPLIASEDFAVWAQERLEGVPYPQPSVEIVVPAGQKLVGDDRARKAPSKSLMVLGLVSVLLAVVVLTRQMKN